MKTGLFGGTFDPVHIGHLLIAETILSDFPLDRIVFVPAACPPHKQDVSVTSAEDRVAMLNLAIENRPDFEISMIEFEKGGISYTIDMVRTIKEHKDFMRDELFLIIGGDSLIELPTWKDPFNLIEMVKILVVERPGYCCRNAGETLCSKVTCIQMPLLGIASSEIRSRVKEGRSIRYRVLSSVEKYICERGLYR